MNQVIDELREKLYAAEAAAKIWQRDIAADEKTIAEEERKQFNAHRLSAAFSGIELNGEEIDWIKSQHDEPATAVAARRKFIAQTETLLSRSESEISLLRGLIEKLEARNKQ